MDFKVSHKERRVYKDGPVEVLMDNICDLFPIFADDPRYAEQNIYTGQGRIAPQDRENIVMDVEVMDSDADELLDRAMFAVMKQRGGDPTEPEDGNQWAEAVLGEVPPPIIVQQVQQAVAREGPGVRVEASTVKNGDRENLVFRVNINNFRSQNY